ncbi:serine palmitoyltransferase small subunit B [Lethenteron reissneri]|uniref:serine palmitoyltransferase small subunit B n=1 Tax=Lethenteron reissneri TaxID=7753 RepID=UPI002AB76CF1|nr:serine palmitoyltransferase small subunit B [Lethenteron reissneri]XP_061431267.1 serine palmitoyltransferase small subunit B [Lethenteron reissneri]XP_061431268.1 serine palmitoyltransferase small subunit B [Lethenteron reissneri]XP_061431269.1 serine palmitoyltransferase small subunit B [Lethenteron reissneri]XP_061431270.1 serine palmitoyltransferase small subunit B [Lethenteron reissneri]XP_061431271.1 serine palmitoyltransferase small subunit B [Lethenteron reissneri]XP_061431272.1 se
MAPPAHRRGIKEYLCWLRYQYLLVTCCYVMEPWERTVFNTIFLSVMAMVAYTTYAFVPMHLRFAASLLYSILGSESPGGGTHASQMEGAIV